MEWKHVGRRKRPRITLNLNLMTTNNNNHPQPPQQTPPISSTITSTSSSSSSSDNNNSKKKNNNNQELMLISKIRSSSTPSTSTNVAEASDLPCSILIDILGRLPLKTLINCRYVCKTWKSLLSESYFYRLYSHHLPTSMILPIKGSSLDNLRKICVVDEDAALIPPRPGYLSRKMRFTTSPFSKFFDPDNFRFQIGNGCNGLICLRNTVTREPTVVWSPIMAQYVVLPDPTTATDDKVVAGLGFCGRTNRYKVLRIFHKSYDPAMRRRAEVYDLGVGLQWRPIGDVPFDIPSVIPGFFTNHSLHWILEHNTNSNANGNGNKRIDDDYNNNANNKNNNISSNCELICGFDFVEETFKAIAAPPIFTQQDKNKYAWSNLGIIIDCLSICAIDAKVFRPDVQVWVMEEYGVPESWSMRLSIRDPTVDWWDPYRWIQVTNFLRNGEIILLCAHCYVLAYNVKKRLFRSVEVLDYSAIAHVPGLISLKDVLTETNGTASLPIKYL